MEYLPDDVFRKRFGAAAAAGFAEVPFAGERAPAIAVEHRAQGVIGGLAWVRNARLRQRRVGPD